MVADAGHWDRWTQLDETDPDLTKHRGIGAPQSARRSEQVDPRAEQGQSN